jgi:acyl carrier protein
MDRSAVESKLTSIFRDFFDEPSLALSNATTANDIEGWDSIAHVDLLMAVEQGFGITFTTREMRSFKNVGDLIEAVSAKAG